MTLFTNDPLSVGKASWAGFDDLSRTGGLFPFSAVINELRIYIFDLSIIIFATSSNSSLSPTLILHLQVLLSVQFVDDP